MNDAPPLPDTRRHTGGDDAASDRHVGVQVPDVVDIRFSLQHGHEGSDDSLKRRVGHGHHHIAIKEESARQSQQHIAQVIHQATFHVEPWKLR